MKTKLQGDKVFRPSKGSKKLALTEDILELARFLQRFIDFEIDSDEIESARSSGSTLRLGLRSSTTTSAPLFVSQAGVVTPGTIAGVMPTIGGTALDAGAAALTFSGSGLEYVVANITGTHSIVGGTFATNLTSRAVSITVSTSAVGSGDITSKTSGQTFRILLAVFNNGVKIAQNATAAITCNFYDDGLQNAALNMSSSRT